MSHFPTKNSEIHCEGVALKNIAQTYGTPVYVYSKAALLESARRLKSAFHSYPTLPCFAVKANSNLKILQTLFREGFGADLVSLGELERALAAGARPSEIVFSGVGKRNDEIERGLHAGIMSFNVESNYELDQLSAIAGRTGHVATVSLRINPNIDAKTNEKIATGLYTTKFGLAETDLAALVSRIQGDKHLSLKGIACHIGSQITEIGPIRQASQRMAEIARNLMALGAPLQWIDLGGGLGIRYRDEAPPSFEEYAKTLIDAVRPTGLRLVIEPGRAVVGNAGMLLTRVIGVKNSPARHFVVLDGAMNDLVRPSLYDAYHHIEAVHTREEGAASVLCDFVGPICETGDYLGKNRHLPMPFAGDLFAIHGAGAYASSMASQYNTRARAPEILVDGSKIQVIRPREDLSSLWQSELPALDESSPS